MPYKNAKQRIAMHINAPDVAKKWDKKSWERTRERGPSAEPQPSAHSRRA